MTIIIIIIIIIKKILIIDAKGIIFTDEHGVKTIDRT